MSENKSSRRICALCFTTDSTISYFSFPSNERRTEWLRLCNITRELPRTAKLCERHFSSESFTKNKNDVKCKPRLKVNALPSQNLDVQHDKDENTIDEHEQNTGNIQSKWCSICGSVQDPNTKRSYHRFPKEFERRMLWLSRLGIEESSTRDWATLRLCHLHFSTESCVRNPLTGKRFLTPNALPIDIREHTASTEDYHHYDDHLERTEDTFTPLPAEYSTVANNLVENEIYSLKNSNSHDRDSEISIDEDGSSTLLQPQSSHKKSSVSTYDKACQTEDDITVVTCEKNIVPNTELVTTPTSSNYSQDQLQDHSYGGAIDRSSKPLRPFPRYVGDIRTPHLSTPTGAKRCLEMSKNVIQQKNKKIALLSRQLKTAQRQIETLKDLIYQLSDVSDEATNDLMVYEVR